MKRRTSKLEPMVEFPAMPPAPGGPVTTPPAGPPVFSLVRPDGRIVELTAEALEAARFAISELPWIPGERNAALLCAARGLDEALQ